MSIATFLQNTPYKKSLKIEGRLDQFGMESLLYLIITLHAQKRFDQEERLILSTPDLKTETTLSHFLNICLAHEQFGEDTILYCAHILRIGGDQDTALKCYQPLAERSDPEALFHMADLYLEKKNTQKALELYEKAAQNGHIPAMYSCWVLLQESDLTQAEEWLYKAAESGLPRAILALKGLRKQESVQQQDQ